MPPERNKIQKHIHRLRQKPEHVRRRYAATISGIVVAFIAIIWVATFPSRFPNLLGSNSSSEQAAVVTGLSQSPAQAPSDQTNQIEDSLNQGDSYSPAPSQEPLPTDSQNDSVDSESNNSNNNSSNTDGVIILTPENQSQ